MNFQHVISNSHSQTQGEGAMGHDVRQEVRELLLGLEGQRADYSFYTDREAQTVLMETENTFTLANSVESTELGLGACSLAQDVLPGALALGK